MIVVAKEDKTQIDVPWKSLSDWEPLLVPSAKVVWRGANGVDYPATLLHYVNGDMKLRFEDGHESAPHYVENLMQIETETQVVNIIHTRRD